MKGTKRFLVGMFVMVLVASACSKSTSGGTTPGGTATSSGPIKVGMALPGPKNDKGFNQSHYQGMLDAQSQGLIIPTVVENVVDPQARIDTLKNLAADNVLVIGVGGEYAEAGKTVAPQFPNVQFVIVNGEQTTAPNLHIYFVRQGTPAYVAGVIAAALTKTKKVGYVGGELIPPTTQSDDGFKAGVAATDPSIQYVSTIVGNFNDAGKAKEAAAAQIASGADVIFALIDAGFPGIEQAVAESGKDVKLMNPIYTRCGEGKNIVGYALLSSAEFVVNIIKDYKNNTLPQGQPRFIGLENAQTQAFVLCPGWEQFQATVTDVTSKINSGATKLPTGV